MALAIEGDDALIAKRLGGERYRIFIGSSSERRQQAEAIARILENEHWTVLPWWSPTAFPLGGSTLPSLISLAPSLDAAMLIVSDEDKVWMRGTEHAAPRDNVLIEYGLFMGLIGGPNHNRVIICRVGSPRTASDLAGITAAVYEEADPVSFIEKIKPWLRTIETASTEESKKLAHVFTDKQKKHLFLDGEDIVRKATKEVVLCAKTPVPFVGARPYNGRGDPPAHEVTQLEAYDQAIDSLALDNQKTITLIGCLNSMIEELEDHRYEPDFKPRVKARLSRLYTISKRLPKSLNILWHSEANITTFVTGDHNTIIWFKNSNEENQWIRLYDPEMAATLKYQVVKESRFISQKEVFDKLRLTKK